MNEKKMKYAQQFEKDAKWADAADQYIQLLNDAPSSSIYERVAWCLSRAGKYSDSIKNLYKLHELEPLSAKWLYMIGYQYYCQKEWGKAIE
jgi:tetratricopeptide (TPR) repeat protein